MPTRKRAAQPTHELPRLAAPAQRALGTAGIHSLADLAKFSEAEIGELHGIGPHALTQLRRALADRVLTFARTQK